jgi:flagellin-like hook-associated protein FlgL
MGSFNFNPASSLLAQRIYRVNTQAQTQSLHKLATGLQINRGADNPAGLITSENLRAILKALEAETRAARRAEDVVNVADGALGDISGLLNEAQALTVENANTAGLSKAERQANQIELDSILSTVNRLASTTSFNGDRLLDGSTTVSVNGADVHLDDVSTSQLGDVLSGGTTYTLDDLKAGGSLSIKNGDLSLAQEVIASARSSVAGLRGELGAFTRHTIGAHLNVLDTSFVNISAAESQIRDLDYASETATLSQLQTLIEASSQALKLTGAQPMNILNLLV